MPLLPLFLRLTFLASSSEEIYSSLSSLSLSGGVESALTEASSSSYPDASASISDSFSLVVDEWEKNWLFLGVALAVEGEDLRRLDCRGEGVRVLAGSGESARLRGVDVGLEVEAGRARGMFDRYV